MLEQVDEADQGETKTEVVQPYSVPIPASMPDTLRCRIIKWEENDVEYCRASWLVTITWCACIVETGRAGQS